MSADYQPRPREVSDLLDALGWSPSIAGEKTGISTRTWRRWRADTDLVPDHIYVWLARLADAHEAHPFPILLP